MPPRFPPCVGVKYPLNGSAMWLISDKSTAIHWSAPSTISLSQALNRHPGYPSSTPLLEKRSGGQLTPPARSTMTESGPNQTTRKRTQEGTHESPRNNQRDYRSRERTCAGNRRNHPIQTLRHTPAAGARN